MTSCGHMFRQEKLLQDSSDGFYLPPHLWNRIWFIRESLLHG